MLRLEVFDVEGSFTTSDASKLDVSRQVSQSKVSGALRLDKRRHAPNGTDASLPSASSSSTAHDTCIPRRNGSLALYSDLDLVKAHLNSALSRVLVVLLPHLFSTKQAHRRRQSQLAASVTPAALARTPVEPRARPAANKAGQSGDGGVRAGYRHGGPRADDHGAPAQPAPPGPEGHDYREGRAGEELERPRRV